MSLGQYRLGRRLIDRVVLFDSLALGDTLGRGDRKLSLSSRFRHGKGRGIVMVHTRMRPHRCHHLRSYLDRAGRNSTL